MDGDSPQPAAGPSFEISHESAPGDVLLAGFSTFGLAGLTAVDYLVDHLELTETGHVGVDQFPAITPFEEGTPRHHTRLFAHESGDATVLANELFVPVGAAAPFADAVYQWVLDNDVEEIAVLSGVPVPHGPEEHRTYYVATEDYQERRLQDTELPPMGTGFLDGVNAELVDRGIDDEVAVGVYITPVHAQVPDVEAAIRLLDTVAPLYGLEVDTGPLEAFASEVTQYYTELAERVEAAEERHQPEERMYM